MTTEQENYIKSVVDTLVFEARKSANTAESCLEAIKNMIPFIQDYYKPYLAECAEIIANIAATQNYMTQEELDNCGGNAPASFDPNL